MFYVVTERETNNMPITETRTFSGIRKMLEFLKQKNQKVVLINYKKNGQKINIYSETD